ncbi:DNA repair protein RecO [candidate division KSB1 bacterium]|nr:DNA repair protein RecO [candidate division KSB1 bacterium]
MPIQKTEAIILKSQKFRETSKILTLYTRRYGKMKVIAKGARGLKSRFYGSLEPLNYISIVFYFKEKRDLQLISQADIRNYFNRIKTDLEKYSLTSIIFEVILRSEYAEDPNPLLFNSVVQFLESLDRAAERYENHFFWLLLKFLQIHGFKPRFDSCIHCGRGHSEEVDFYFSINRGGLTCRNCKTSEATGIMLSHPTINYLLALENTSHLGISAVIDSKQAVKESARLLNRFMNYHIEGLAGLKSMDFLSHIRSSANTKNQKSNTGNGAQTEQDT